MSSQKKTVIESRIEVWTDAGIPDDRAAMWWVITVGPGEEGYVRGSGPSLAEALRNTAQSLSRITDIRESAEIMKAERRARP